MSETRMPNDGRPRWPSGKLKWVLRNPNGYAYFRRADYPSVELPGGEESPEFLAVWDDCVAQCEKRRQAFVAKKKASALAIGTIAHAVADLLRSANFKARARESSTQENMGYSLNAIANGPYGNLLLSEMTAKDLRDIFYNMDDRPGRQRNHRAAWSMLFKHGMRRGWCDSNLMRGADVELAPLSKNGIPNVSHEVLAQYRDFYGADSIEWCNVWVLYESGAAAIDAIGLGQANISGNILKLTRHKTDITAYKPYSNALLPTIERCRGGPVVGPWIVDRKGKPFVPTGLKTTTKHSKKFCQWLIRTFIKAGLQNVSAHSLRKRAATDYAEAGHTTLELQSAFGWLTPSEAARYTAEANREKVARNMAERLTNPAGC